MFDELLKKKLATFITWVAASLEPINSQKAFLVSPPPIYPIEAIRFFLQI